MITFAQRILAHLRCRDVRVVTARLESTRTQKSVAFVAQIEQARNLDDFTLIISGIDIRLWLAPTTGLPLPFVSYGGSALIVNLAAAGILYRISALNGETDALARQRWSREGR